MNYCLPNYIGNISSSSLPEFQDPVSKISQIICQPEDVYEVMMHLYVSKAVGPDGIDNELLKESAGVLSKPLCVLFNFCLSLGTFPDIWKAAQVTPIYKKGYPSQCTNYHPISLLPCISKIFEKLLLKHKHTFLCNNKLITKHQSGFTPGNSTINQLISICDDIYKNLESKK